jgi:DNA-binding CsgD family transcriptional regulator
MSVEVGQSLQLPLETSSGKVESRLQPFMQVASAQCAQQADKFGFPYYQFIVRIVIAPGIPLQVFINGGPRGRRASDSRFGPIGDRILAKALVSSMPFEWSDTSSAAADASPGFGDRRVAPAMHYGFAVPLHGPFGASGVLIFGGGTAMTESRHLKDELFRHAHWAAVEFFGQFALKIREEFDRKPREQLTERQQLALALAARGQSLAEVGQALKIHISTARYLIASAAAKLGVRTREEAIVRFTLNSKHLRGLYPATVEESDVCYFPQHSQDPRPDPETAQQLQV